MDLRAPAALSVPAQLPQGSSHPAHGPRPDVSCLSGLSVPAPATLRQCRSPAPHSPPLPGHEPHQAAPTHRSTSWPHLGPSSGPCPAILGLCLTLVPLTGPHPDPHLWADVPAVPNAGGWGCPRLPCSPAGAVGWPCLPALSCCPWEKQAVRAGIQLRLSSGMSQPPLIYSFLFDSRLYIVTLT